MSEYSAYIIHFSYHHNDYNWEKEINEIKELKPDFILCWCCEEYDFRYIFRNFFPKIQNWLLENNKIIKILGGYPDNFEVYPNVYLEKTFCTMNFFFGLLYNCVRDKIELDTNEVTKVYSCYNNNNKYERALLVDELAKRKLLGHGIVTFHNPKNVQESAGIEKKVFQGWKYHDGSILYDEPDFVLNSKPSFEAVSIPKSYLKGFMDVVTESVTTPIEFYYTEKTARPIATLKPFLVLSSHKFHQEILVKEFNLELYDEIFDYSFDDKESVEERIDGIVNNVEKLVQKFSKNYLHETYALIKPKLLRNRQKLINCYNDKNKMLPRSFNFMSEGKPYKLYGQLENIKGFLENYKGYGWIN